MNGASAMSGVKVVLKGGSPWGFRIAGGNKFSEPLTVSKINYKSKAFNSGVEVGDIICKINCQSTQGLNFGEVLCLIKSASDQLILDLIRPSEFPNLLLNGGQTAYVLPVWKPLNSDENASRFANNLSSFTGQQEFRPDHFIPPVSLIAICEASVDSTMQNVALITKTGQPFISCRSQTSTVAGETDMRNEPLSIDTTQNFHLYPSSPTIKTSHNISQSSGGWTGFRGGLYSTLPSKSTLQNHRPMACGRGNTMQQQSHQQANHHGTQEGHVWPFSYQHQDSHSSRSNDQLHKGQGLNVEQHCVRDQLSQGYSMQNFQPPVQHSLAHLQPHADRGFWDNSSGLSITCPISRNSSCVTADYEYCAYSTLPKIKPLRSSSTCPAQADVPDVGEMCSTFSAWSCDRGNSSNYCLQSWAECRSPSSDNIISSSDSRDTVIARGDHLQPPCTDATVQLEPHPVPELISVPVIHEMSVFLARSSENNASLQKSDGGKHASNLSTSAMLAHNSVQGEQTPGDVPPVWWSSGVPAKPAKQYQPVWLNSAKSASPKSDASSITSNPAVCRSLGHPASSASYDPWSKESIGRPVDENGLDRDALGDSREDVTRLPPTQSPYVTLLKKNREGMISHGARYIGLNYSWQTDNDHSKVSLNDAAVNGITPYTKKLDENRTAPDAIKAEDKVEALFSIRKNNKDETQRGWYKQMYKTLHITDRKKETNKYRPTYTFPDTTLEVKKPAEEVAPYRPAFEKSSSWTADCTSSVGADDSGYRSDPEGRYKHLFHRHRAIAEKFSHKPKRRLSDNGGNGGWAPANVRSRIEVYRNQPRCIADYEPGFSSIAFREAKTDNQYNPPIQKPGELVQYSVGTQMGRPSNCSAQQQDNGDDSTHPSDMYRQVQLGGDIPVKGLQRPGPNKSQTFKHPTSDVKRTQAEQGNLVKDRRRHKEDEAYRKLRLGELFEEERQKKIRRDEAAAKTRRHHDYYASGPMSPISPNRFDGAPSVPSPSRSCSSHYKDANHRQTGLSVFPECRRGFRIHGKARAIYNFTAQNARELSVRRGDIIYLLRQIDQNWYEGERNGSIGIFPASYVEVITSIDIARTAAMQSEGSGRAKHDFIAQSSMELTLCKGEFVVLLRKVDDNWYEGRLGSQQQGIFPANYVEVAREPSTPFITPSPSVIATPMSVTPDTLSPAYVDAAPSPPPHPSPSAFERRSPSADCQAIHHVAHYLPHYRHSGQPCASSLLRPANWSLSYQHVDVGTRRNPDSNPSLGKSLSHHTNIPTANGMRSSDSWTGVSSRVEPYMNGNRSTVHMSNVEASRVADDDLALARNINYKVYGHTQVFEVVSQLQ